jgi:hypothetical protein
MIGENALLDYEETKKDVTNSSLQVEVRSGTKLSDIATLLDMKTSDLLTMNRQYKKGLIPKEKHLYKILIPEEKMMLFYMRYEDKEKIKIIKPHLISHYVVMGDTLESIAALYEADIEDIIMSNHLEDNFLEVDKLLVIPVSKKYFENSLKE